MSDLEGRQDKGPKRQSDSRIEDFIKDQSARNRLDERTVKAYQLDLGLFYDWMRENGIASFDSEVAERYLDYLSREKKLRFSTVTRKYRVLSYFLEYLSKEGHLSGYRPLTPPAPTPQAAERAEKAGRRGDGGMAGMPGPDGRIGVPGPEGIVGAPEAEGIIGVSGAFGTASVPVSPVLEGAAGMSAVMGAETPVVRKKGHFLSKAEVDRFFVALDREYEELDSDFRKRVCLRDRVMMELLFYHGLEVSEILRLELADYDGKTGMLWVRRKRQTEGDRVSDEDRDGADPREAIRDRDIERADGGNRGRRKDKERSVRIFSRELRERLELWIREHGYFERVEGYRDVMFLSKLGKPLSMKMVISIFDKYRIMAGIGRECTPKDLKRSMERYARELMMERCG
ncbi:MAG: tyrosine-type recombinase/integrase [Lachnospiraceae bacterium]|nr:tyrosine-type recombinase/integrase [Lachnospiraceae bacterium]